MFAADKYGQIAPEVILFSLRFFNETNVSHVATVKALLTSRQTPVTLILSSSPCERFQSLSCMFFLSSFYVSLSLVSLCDGTADAGFLLKRLYSMTMLHFIASLLLAAN